MRNKFKIEPKYLGRLFFLCFVGTYNSFTKLFEDACNGSKIEATEINDSPIFIIGQWRSGTTHLHYLLSLSENLHAPTLFQTMFPTHFVYSQRFCEPLIDRLSPATRPMDNIALSASASSEDEFALAALSTVSPYMRFLFPVTEDNGYTVLDPKELAGENLAKWKEAMIYFLKKLTFSKDKRILLKSPTHLGRVATILEMLPKAKFVHIYRNPYSVFMSSRKLWRDGVSHSFLQDPTPEQVEEIIFTWHLELFRLFERDRHLIPAGSLTEVSYEDLEADPERCLSKIHQDLGLPGFDRYWQKAEAYLASLKDYQKNVFEIDEATRKKVRERWGEMFVRYGYPM